MKPEKVFRNLLGKALVYADRVEISQGFWAGGGTKSSTTIPISAITAMTLKGSMFHAPYLQFGVHGSASDDKAYRWGCHIRQGEELKRYLEERIRSVRLAGEARQTSQASLSIAAEISALAKLKDEGHLTPDEFESAKKRLLGMGV